MFLFQNLFLGRITFKCARPNNPDGILITAPRFNSELPFALNAAIITGLSSQNTITLTVFKKSFQVCADAFAWQNHLQGESRISVKKNMKWNPVSAKQIKLPRQIKHDFKEIDEMIATVDKNEDWKISYSEFRVRNSLVAPKSENISDIRDKFKTKIQHNWVKWLLLGGKAETCIK